MNPPPDLPAGRPLEAPEARDLLTHTARPSLATPRDRRAHALGMLGSGVVAAGMVLVSSLSRHQSWYLVTLAASWLAAVALIVLVDRVAGRRSSSIPRGTAKAARVASWTGFGILVVGRPLLDALADDGPTPLGAALVLSAAIFLPFAAAAHRIWWDGWVPRRRR